MKTRNNKKKNQQNRNANHSAIDLDALRDTANKESGKLAQACTQYNNEMLRMLDDDSFLVYLEDDRFPAYSEDGWCLSADAINLASKVCADVDLAFPFSCKLTENHIFHQEWIITTIRLLILYSQFQLAVDDIEGAWKYFKAVYGVLTRHHVNLDYKDNLSFQLVLNEVFSSRVINASEESREFYKNVLRKAYSLHMKKCGDSFAAVISLHKETMDLYSHPNASEMIAGSRKTQQEFVRIAKIVQSQFQQMQVNHQLTFEYQIFFIRLYFCIFDFHDLTHPRTVWFFEHNEKCFEFNFRMGSLKERHSYLQLWASLKNDYIDPAFTLIKNTSAEAVKAELGGLHQFKKCLDDWYFKIISALDLFSTWGCDTKDGIKSEIDLCLEIYREPRELLLNLDEEIQYVSKKLNILLVAASRYQYKLAVKGVDSKKIFEKISILKKTINPLKENLRQQDENKQKIADEVSKELIAEENKRQALLQEKARQRPTLFAPIVFTRDESSEESLEDAEIEDAKSGIVVFPEQLALEQLEEEASKLAGDLKSRSGKMLRFLKGRSHEKIPLTSDLHERTLDRLHIMLCEYYQLVGLHEKYQSLAASEEVTSNPAIQEGLSIGRQVLKQSTKIIMENIQSITGLIKEMDQYQKATKNAVIYDMGARACGPHASEKEILSEGRKRFNHIGEEKKANKQNLSQHTQQKNFLDLIQLSFSSFDYLQDKVKHFLADDFNGVKHDIGFFKRERNNRSHAELTEGGFEEMLALLHKQQYKKNHCADHLRMSLLHLQKAQAFFEKENAQEDVEMMRAEINELKALLGCGVGLSLINKPK